MQNKLQELTDRLYNEGLSKGKKEAEDLKAAAAKEAEKIIAEARKKAAEIISNAGKEAEDLKTKVSNDVKMASSQTIAAVKQQLENTIITKAISADLSKNLENPELVRSMLETVAKSFNAAEAAPAGLEAIVPASMQKALENDFGKKAAQAMDNGIDVTFSKQISGGFKIGPKNGGYMISFAEGDFEKILCEYLRPTAKKLLFG